MSEVIAGGIIALLGVVLGGAIGISGRTNNREGDK